MPKIKVLIVDDHAPVRSLLKQLLEADREIEVVGEACDGLEAIDLTSQLQPNVIVMDIAMPRMNGLDATRSIRQKWPAVSVILVTGMASESYNQVVELCGAQAFLPKENMGALLLRTVHRVVQAAMIH